MLTPVGLTCFKPPLLAPVTAKMNTELRPERFLKLDEVKCRTGLGKSMIYRLIQEGKLPAPYKLSPGAARWSERELAPGSTASRMVSRARNAASERASAHPVTPDYGRLRLTMYRQFDRGARSRTGATSLGFRAEFFCGTFRGTRKNSSIGKLGRTMACRLSSNPTLSAIGSD